MIGCIIIQLYQKILKIIQITMERLWIINVLIAGKKKHFFILLIKHYFAGVVEFGRHRRLKISRVLLMQVRVLSPVPTFQ